MYRLYDYPPSGNGYDSVAPSFATPTLTTKDKIQQYGHHH